MPKQKVENKIYKDPALKRVLIWGAVISVFLGILANIILAVAFSFVENSFKFSFIKALGKMVSKEILVISLVVIIAVFLAIFFRFNSHNKLKKRALKKASDLEESHFQTMKELHENANVRFTLFSNMENEDDGIPLFAKKNNKTKQLDLVLLHSVHSLIIGGTGTGKTTTFILPTINILAKSKTKPTLILTDPKGELHRTTRNMLVKEGYNVLFMDFTDPFNSLRWNPFSESIRNVLKYREFNKELILYKLGKYYYDNKEFQTRTIAEDYKKQKLAIIDDKVVQDVNGIMDSFFQTKSQHDPGWEDSSRNFLKGIALNLIFLLKNYYIEPSQFNLYTIYEIVARYVDSNMHDEDSIIQRFFKIQGEGNSARSKADNLLTVEERTLTSYLGHVKDFVSFIADEGLQFIVTEDDLDLWNFDEKPTALFIKMKIGSQTSINNLAATLITSYYSTILDKAVANYKNGETTTETLKRKAFFLLDEFCNIPLIKVAPNIASFGRSYGIVFCPVIQDYQQLDKMYEKESHTIQANCMATVFIGSGDEETLEKISKACGKKKTIQEGYSVSKDASTNISVKEEPIIHPSKLRTLNDPGNYMGNVIFVNTLGNYPIWGEYTPIFEALDEYGNSENYKVDITPRRYNKSKYFFDIKEFLLRLDESLEDVIDYEEILNSDNKENISNEAVDTKTDDEEIKMKQMKDSLIPILTNIKSMVTAKCYNAIEELNFDEAIKELSRIIEIYEKDGTWIMTSYLIKVRIILLRLKNRKENVPIND
jgi:type IV secretion system protein VirD4